MEIILCKYWNPGINVTHAGSDQIENRDSPIQFYPSQLRVSANTKHQSNTSALF